MKKILITGSSSGFGYETVKHLAKKGHHVIATMRNVNGKNAQAAMSLKDFAKKNKCKIEIVEMDVTSDASVAKASESFPVVDVLINNAGCGYGGPVEAFTAKDCQDQLNLNITGTLRATKAVLPGMRKQRSGLIIQVSSIAGRGAFPGFGIYHASKWGLEGLSESLRYELAPLGIDVVLVEPGPFSTHFFENITAPIAEDLAKDYAHVNEFYEGFVKQVQEMFEDPNIPTDPSIVVEIFDKLIDTPAGKRPLRTIAGLDFGFRKLNETVEPLRKASLESMGIQEWDGPKAQMSKA